MPNQQPDQVVTPEFGVAVRGKPVLEDQVEPLLFRQSGNRTARIIQSQLHPGKLRLENSLPRDGGRQAPFQRVGRVGPRGAG